MIKKKQLDSCLSQIDDFEKPIWKLEQYMTPFDMASSMIQHIMMNEDISGQIVADLGCGTGMLSAAILCAGAHHVIGYEIDKQAADIAQKNLEEVHGSGFDIILTDIQYHKFKGQVDTIIMNPPFGTKNENIDTIFLKKSFGKTIIYDKNIVEEIFIHYIRLQLDNIYKDQENQIIELLRFQKHTSFHYQNDS
ncbi:hypothetical protein pb186bvf_003685 [Paramecium bursaria]